MIGIKKMITKDKINRLLLASSQIKMIKVTKFKSIKLLKIRSIDHKMNRRRIKSKINYKYSRIQKVSILSSSNYQIQKINKIKKINNQKRIKIIKLIKHSSSKSIHKLVYKTQIFRQNINRFKKHIRQSNRQLKLFKIRNKLKNRNKNLLHLK